MAVIVFLLDSLLLACALLLLAPRLTGLALHEWLGIGVAVPITLHLLLASGWIAKSFAQFRALPLRSRVNVVLNGALLVLMLLALLSGVVISQIALPRLGVNTILDRDWRKLHNYPLNVLVLVLGLHLAMNWSWIAGAIRRKWRRSSFAMPRSMSQMLRVCFGLLFVSALACLLTWGWLGPPSRHREYRQDEVARFKPSAVHGLIQLAGETLLVALVAFAGRKWLRVRL